jgi:hypothetical protein
MKEAAPAGSTSNVQLVDRETPRPTCLTEPEHSSAAVIGLFREDVFFFEHLDNTVKTLRTWNNSFASFL